MTNNQKAVQLLREFANFSSTGFRGVVRMKRLQEEARELLAKMYRDSARKEKAQP